MKHANTSGNEQLAVRQGRADAIRELHESTSAQRRLNRYRSQTSRQQQDERSEDHKNIARRPWHGADRPSAKIDARKASNPFGKPRQRRSNFSFIHAAGGIPCHLNHGGVNCRLRWDTPPEQLDYNPLLIHCTEGLVEVEHPYVFIARTAFKELLEAPGGCEKVKPLLGNLIAPLRAALLSKDAEVFLATLSAIQQLSDTMGPSLNRYIGSLLIQISKKAFLPKFRQPVSVTLHILFSNGGQEAYKIIKAKVPTFSPM